MHPWIPADSLTRNLRILSEKGGRVRMAIVWSEGKGWLAGERLPVDPCFFTSIKRV
jgi:hypothetical protein